MDRPSLAKSMKEIALLKGRFLLRSGTYSDYYFDKYRFESQPHLLSAIAKHMAPLIPPETEILAGLELGGVPIATALSLETGLPMIFVRKEAKTYGTCQIAEGMDFEGKKICLIEDVITTGGAVVDAFHELSKKSVDILGVICAIYRGDGPPQKLNSLGLELFPLFKKEDFEATQTE